MTRTAKTATALGALALMTACSAGGGPTTAPSTTASTAPAASDTGTPSACGRSPNPETCTEWQATKPATGQALFDTWAQDQSTSSQMLCTAVPDTSWSKYLGEGFYRFVQDGSTCTVSSGDNQLVVRIGMYGKSPLNEYLATFQRDPKIAASTQSITVAGVPAMRTAIKSDTDGVGDDREDLTLAPTGDAAKPGVLQVQITLQPPRGKARTTPVDRTRLQFRDELVGDLLKTLFPQR
ncbi:hypothetical protein SUDANB95_07942 (plasmid) [Actinosynnema sp. ALI-1.44]